MDQIFVHYTIYKSIINIDCCYFLSNFEGKYNQLIECYLEDHNIFQSLQNTSPLTLVTNDKDFPTSIIRNNGEPNKITLSIMRSETDSIQNHVIAFTAIVNFNFYLSSLQLVHL